MILRLLRLRLAVLMMALIGGTALVLPAVPAFAAEAGVDWVSQSAAADNQWSAVAYGNGLFVAVSYSGTGNRVMTSPDGITWTARTSAANNSWSSVAYGNGLFVVVGFSGTNNRVMTSPDGITWTSRTSAANNTWVSVAYGNGRFVAVSRTAGLGNQVMTSLDGINWTMRTSASDRDWQGVTYGSGLFVAVASTGTGNRVMTSPDGITWTSRASAADNQWVGVTYGNGTFVAVSITGTSRVMTSGSGSTPATDPSEWTNYYQALPLPESRSCTDITREQNVAAAYGTDVTGGWVMGWEPWVDRGLGGWACRRTLTNTGGTTWVVGS